MPNPFGSQAKSSSRDKFDSITGIKGGGHGFAGSSHMKSAGKDGEHKFWSGKSKTHDLEQKRHGGRSKGRADKYARGGAVALARGGHAKKKGAPENVTINVTQAPPPPDATMGKMPPLPPPGAAGPGPGGPPPPPPMGGPPPGGGGPNPMAGIGKGMGFARGGRASGGHRGTPKQKIEGDSKYDLKHFRDYANRKPQEKAESFLQAHTQPVGKVQGRRNEPGEPGERARGGRTGDSILNSPVKSAGSQSGVGRLQKIAMHGGSKHTGWK